MQVKNENFIEANDVIQGYVLQFGSPITLTFLGHKLLFIIINYLNFLVINIIIEAKPTFWHNLYTRSRKT